MTPPEQAAVRQAGQRDIRRLAELWAHAFPGERTVEQRVAQLEEGGVFGGIEQSWYLEREGRVAGAFRAYALTQYLHGAPLPMLGLAAVAVAADARRAGIGSRLCAAAVRVGRDRGDVVSVLYPFRPEFYRRLGWGLAGTRHAHRFAPESLPVRVSRPRVHIATAGRLPAIAECYDTVARAAHGLIQRTPAIWRNLLAQPQHHVYALHANEEVRGYMLVSYGRTGSEKELTIHELLARDAEAYAELTSWIALQRGAWPVVAYEALPEERFDLLLSEPRPPRTTAQRGLWFQTARLVRGPMLRLLDVPRALEAPRAWPAVNALRFTLRVRDELLPENSGPWQVEFDGNEVRCRAGSAASREASLSIDAAAFAQVYAGELAATDAERFGWATISGAGAALDDLFRSAHTLRLLDEF
jgi:predicted acetyltransferase